MVLLVSAFWKYNGEWNTRHKIILYRLITTIPSPFLFLRSILFKKTVFTALTNKNSMTKFALLWGEAQLCFPYVCLKKKKSFTTLQMTYVMCKVTGRKELESLKVQKQISQHSPFPPYFVNFFAKFEVCLFSAIFVWVLPYICLLFFHFCLFSCHHQAIFAQF